MLSIFNARMDGNEKSLIIKESYAGRLLPAIDDFSKLVKFRESGHENS